MLFPREYESRGVVGILKMVSPIGKVDFIYRRAILKSENETRPIAPTVKQDAKSGSFAATVV